jgi:hypothetical protein
MLRSLAIFLAIELQKVQGAALYSLIVDKSGRARNIEL